MRNILKVKNVSDYSRYVGAEDFHPLVSIIDYAEVSPIRHSLNDYSVYGLFLRDDVSVDLTYGCGRYDYRQGTLICVAPGQIGGKEDNGEKVSISGWALLFHPDLLHGTWLEKKIKEYSFFDYRVNEALHMTQEEHETIVVLLRQIQNELQKPGDAFQNDIIVGYIGLILDFCLRFYNRQFLTRSLENSDTLMKFNSLLHDYFEDGRQLSEGMPTVRYCAERLCMSPNYFSDLIKRITDDTAGNYIRRYVIRLAKNELAAGSDIARTAYSLGFGYSQHFSRLFKKQTGMTPKEYCRSLQK